MTRLTLIPTMSSPVCYRCMKRDVTSPGDLCGYCGRIEPRKRGERLEDWDLQKMIDTQDASERDIVPEAKNKWWRNEVPYDPDWF